MLIAASAFSQTLAFIQGDKHTEENGVTTYSTKISSLKQKKPTVHINLVAQLAETNEEYFIILTLPTKTLDKVSESSELQLKFANGEALALPVLKKIEAKDKESIMIPYRISKKEIRNISSNAVNRITITGTENEITFTLPGETMSIIVKRHYQELKALIASDNSSTRSKSNSVTQTKVANKDVSNNLMVIHETPDTKAINVRNLANMILGPVYEDTFFVQERGTGETFIFNKKGEELAKLTLKETSSKELYFDNGRALVELPNGDFAIIDTKGNIVNDLKSIPNLYNNTYCHTFVDGLARVFIVTRKQTTDEILLDYIPGEYHYMDLSGTIVRSDLELATDVKRLSCDRRLHMDSKTKKYGYLDSACKTVIPFQYVDGSCFSEGLAAVAIQRGNEILWGFIDTEGKWVIEPMFSNRPDDFHEGYTVVAKKNSKYVYINKAGQVCSEEYETALRFFKGLAIVVSNGNRCFINTSFQKNEALTLPKGRNRYTYYDETSTMYGNYLYSHTGELISKQVDPFYTDVTVYREGSAHKGYVNTKGEIIIKFVGSEF